MKYGQSLLSSCRENNKKRLVLKQENLHRLNVKDVSSFLVHS